jgi:hypothetical protein
MNKRIKKEWVKALRSGEFAQARGALKDGGSYCCLGVLCELHRRKFGGKWTPGAEGGVEYLNANGVLPVRVLEWAELTERSPVVPSSCVDLATLNDSGSPFTKIADVIEKEL